MVQKGGNMRKLFIGIILLFTLFVNAQSIAEWQTSMGNFKVELREDLVPITAGNFIDLVNQEFYDDLIFHRVIDGFMIQDGCPNGTGTGGPGYSIEDEFHPDLLHSSAGVLSMANSGPNTGGSQYFITLAATNWLNNAHAVFGNVIEGIDIVQAIGDVDTSANDRPIVPVDIYSIRILTPQPDAVFPEESNLEVYINNEINFYAMSFSETLIYQWFVENELIEHTDFSYVHTFDTAGIIPIKLIITNDGGFSYTYEWEVIVDPTSNENNYNKPPVVSLSNFPNPFNPSTKIILNSQEKIENAQVSIFDIKGRCVKTWDFKSSYEKEISLEWDGKTEDNKNCSSGVYFIKAQVNGKFNSFLKSILLK